MKIRNSFISNSSSSSFVILLEDSFDVNTFVEKNLERLVNEWENYTEELIEIYSNADENFKLDEIDIDEFTFNKEICIKVLEHIIKNFKNVYQYDMNSEFGIIDGYYFDSDPRKCLENDVHSDGDGYFEFIRELEIMEKLKSIKENKNEN